MLKSQSTYCKRPRILIEDPYLAMMVYQTTPLGPDQPSPMEILHGHKAWSDLPLANAALKSKGLIQTAVESTKNQQSTDKNQLKEGHPVMFKTPPEKKTWRKAVVLRYLGHRSYKICAKDNTIYRCTRFYLKLYTPQSAQATPSPMQAPTYCQALKDYTCTKMDGSISCKCEV